MAQERRFGRRVALPSTLQIVRELKALMNADPATAAPASIEPGHRSWADARPLPNPATDPHD